MDPTPNETASHEQTTPRRTEPGRSDKSAKESASKTTADRTVTLILEARRELFMRHPLMTQTETTLLTPPIEHLIAIVRRIILLRQVGIYFSGTSGIGKSKALDFVEAVLRKEFKRLYLLKHNALNKQVPSIRAFFMHFLKTVKHSEKRGETYPLRERVLNKIVECAIQSGLGLAVLLIDEAQNMNVDDFLFLKDLGNEAAHEGVVLLPILMAQEPDFEGVLERLRMDGRLDLISRFAIKKITFAGFNSLSDIKSVLREIDEQIYPRERGWSWTQFFMPAAYANGFRLEHCAADLFEVLKSMSPAKNARSHIFPARQLFAAIRAFLVSGAGIDKPTFHAGQAMWREALEAVEIEEAMRLSSGAATRGKVRVNV